MRKTSYIQTLALLCLFGCESVVEFNGPRSDSGMDVLDAELDGRLGDAGMDRLPDGDGDHIDMGVIDVALIDTTLTDSAPLDSADETRPLDGSTSADTASDQTSDSGPLPSPSGLLIAANNYTCAEITSSLRCWGNTPPYTVLSTTSMTSVGASGRAICAIQNGVLGCMGNGSSRQLGRAFVGSDMNFVAVEQLEGRTANEVDVGADHACALFGDATLRCWGSASYGQLGWSDRESRYYPTQVGQVSEPIVMFATGGAFTTALGQSGMLYYWGADIFGMPDGHLVQLSGTGLLPIVQMTGGQILCMRRSDGAVFCRRQGSNLDQVPGLNATDLDSGVTHRCAITAAGLVQCWGQNDRGQLGTGSLGPIQDVPVTVQGLGLETPVALALGYAHSCVRMASGAVFCWGANDHGQVTGTAGEDRTVASRVPGT